MSNALGMGTTCSIAIPEGAPKPWPTVYLLHGLSDDSSMWQRRTSIERYAEAHGIVVVMPDGGRGWYSNASNGFHNYESHILETVERVEALLPVRTDRAGRGIGGLSMGGYGSLKIALKYPELFASVVAHSGVLDIKSWHSSSDRRAMLHHIFGERLSPSEDCQALAKKLAKKSGKSSGKSAVIPRIRIDCGVDDFLIEHNRDMHKLLVKLNIDHQYDEYPGSHNWEYWDKHVQTALAFHAQGFTAVKTVKQKSPKKPVNKTR